MTDRIADLEAELQQIITRWEDGQNHDEGAFDPDCPICPILRDLRALLASAGEREGVEPVAWRLVPVEPTDDMKIAGANNLRGTAVNSRESAASWAYQAMLKAAPAAPPASIAGRLMTAVALIASSECQNFDAEMLRAIANAALDDAKVAGVKPEQEK